MADNKISELPAITGANLADADKFVVVDSSSAQTNSITRAELAKGLLAGSTNVGIGVSSPSSTLHVSGGTDNLVAQFVSSDTLSYVSFSDSNTTSNTSVALGAAGDNFTVYTGSSYGTERMRIDSSGNVGIGTTSPAKLLHVNSGTTNEVARFESTDGTAYLSIMDSATSSSLQGIGSAGNDLTFYSNNAERMRIDSSGKTQITHASDEPALQLNCTNASFTDSSLIVYTSRATTNSSYNHLACYNGNFTGQFIIRDSGNAVNTNNSYGAVSDIKLKENIIDSGSQWDDIKALRVRKYSMKADNLNEPNRLGVIAQELETAGMSGLVSEAPDRDEDGNDLDTVTKSVSYSVLYMKAVKALQEAMERIETLEAKVQALENA